jgi:site-specific recombinase XerD
VIRPTVDRLAGVREHYHKELAEVRGFSTSTLNHHSATVADFLKRALYPVRQLRSLTRDDIERYIELKSKENSRQSMQHVVAALRSFLRFCYDQGEIRSQLDRIDTPRAYRGEQLPRALRWPDIQALLRSIDRDRGTGERDYTIVHLMAHYGLRPSEIVALRFDSIDWGNRTLSVQQRKTRSDLLLPIATSTVTVLRRYLKRFRGKYATRYTELFVRDHCPHRPLKNSAVCEMFSRRAQQAGFGHRKYSAYSLRHGFAVRLLERGVGVKAIGDVLGHRDLESTCVYLRLDTDSLRHVALPVPQIGNTGTTP